MLAARGPETRREVRNRTFGQITRERVQYRVAEAPSRRCLCASRTRADDELIRVEVRNETQRVGRWMLTVRVDDEHERAGCRANAGLHRGAIAFVVWMANDAGAGRRRARRRVVRGPVVDDEDLVPWRGRTEVANQRVD